MEIPKKSAKKHLGQHFLNNISVIRKIISAIPKNDYEIYEIGSGYGALTKYLLEYYKVQAIEIDFDCINYLQNFGNPGLNIINCDILSYDFSNFANKCVVGNLPYNISTKIMENLVYQPCAYAVFMFQKEVAEKILENSKLGIFLQSRYHIKKLVNCAKKDFTPAPKVDSTVLTFQFHGLYDLDFKKLKIVSEILFRHPRKKIKCIEKIDKTLFGALCFHGLDLNLRPQDLKKEIIYEICRKI